MRRAQVILEGVENCGNYPSSFFSLCSAYGAGAQNTVVRPTEIDDCPRCVCRNVTLSALSTCSWLEKWKKADTIGSQFMKLPGLAVAGDKPSKRLTEAAQEDNPTTTLFRNQIRSRNALIESRQERRI
jgi:hypothetical protein